MKTTHLNSVLTLLLVVAIGFTSCRPAAHIEKDDTVDFKKYKTYSWIPAQEKSLKERNSNDIIDAKVKAVVAKELKKDGWVESRSNPQVLLDYNIMVEKNVKRENNPVYSRPFTRYFYNPVSRRLTGFYYPSEMMGYDRFEIPYREGTLTIHMIDNRSNKLVWQGWSTDEVKNYHLTGKEISSAVKSIFKKFSPDEG